jgi:phospholipid/cholesterol/gamma-HCH transport system permease protein
MDMATGAMTRKWQLEVDRSVENLLSLRLTGAWLSEADLPEASGTLQREDVATASKVVFDVSSLTAWDSGLLTFLVGVIDACEATGTEVDRAGLPVGVTRLLRLAYAVPERKGARRADQREPFLAYVGKQVLEMLRSAGQMLAFLGESILSVGRLLRGKAVFRRVDLGLLMQETGAQALPIVSLISALIGMILAFVGAYQLKMFGAEIYIAAGVALGTVREMGPIMTGILLAGRTGAAFAAQIGTMQVNEEVDALETMGISAFDFLVLPRMIALGIMMPMLCLYSDMMGIVGGAIVGSSMFGIPLTQYFEQTWKSVGMGDFTIGIVKSAIFGIVVAVAGCLRGMQCGRSASAVGDAATSAVVTGIVAIIVLDSLAAIISTVVGI